ncbi:MULTISPECIES: hypothetical protein [Sorangium]|uniref:Uncharacterized protein n=1 Tax=Sorangium cellulosum TaxID=56 RepID=A0A4P2R3J8_SORCE|nr:MULTISPECIES: hypothetical protein [Sorangium]AUX37629.1 uncharacterized protein SOCE836_098590 [Sorangium cellulosum]WCQ96919.1 hypothetical protein NQZ70_09709 [Sorangium sp. Soce836]
MAGRRSGLAGLERVLRALEPGSHNIGDYIAEHDEELSVLLGVDTGELRGLAGKLDEEAAPRVRALLQQRAEARTLRHQAARRDAVLAAAQRLAMTAVWRESAALLDMSALLGDLLADVTIQHISLVSRVFAVHLPRKKLVEVADVLPRQFADLVSWVDRTGLHFRWRQGRGGLSLYSQVVPASESAHVLHVNIQAPAFRKHRPAPASPERRSHNAPRPNPESAAPAGPRSTGWLADALTEAAFPA